MNIGYVLSLTSIIIAAFSQMLLKKGANKEYSNFIRQYLNVYVICGYGMMFTALLLTMMAYKHLAYRVVPLLESLGFIFVMILSRIFFKEEITLRKVLGVCIIIAGIVIYYI